MIMMTVEEYATRKAAGMVEIVKIGAAHAIVTRKFSPDTGEEIQPEIQALDIKQLQDQQSVLQIQIDAIGTMISDMQALTKV